VVTDQLHGTRSLRAAGYNYYEVRRLLRAGDLSPVRRGAYVVGQLPERAEARHRLAVLAAVRELDAEAVVSHVSAAVLHGLPTWTIPLARVHVTKSRPDHGRRSRSVHVHPAHLDPTEIVMVDGIAVTSVARTVIDAARGATFEQAVVVTDAALAIGLVTRDELARALGNLARRRGVSLARRAVEFADGRAESVGESRSRVAIARAGLPAPRLQWPVRRPNGTLIGRVDFAWLDYGVIGEFDGEIKYGRLLRPDQSPGDVVFEEKLREDELRTEAWEVVRWTWPELAAFAAVATRWHRAQTRHLARLTRPIP
jgi:hypothetical protein